MKKIALLITSVCLASSVFAADSSAGTKKDLVAPTAVAPVVTTSVPKVLKTQQSKMVTCNKSATGMKGDERKAFMSNCLKKEPTTSASAPTSSVSAPIVLEPVASAPVQAASKAKTK